MNERKQSSSAYPYQFFMASSTDHVTGVAGATVSLQVSKNGGAFAPAAGAVSELGFGWYLLAGHAADRATLGGCAIHASAPGCDPFDGKINVVPWDPFDASLSLAALPSAAAGTAGGLPTVDASNSVKLQAGTGPNQLNLSGGSVSVFANGDKGGYALTQAFPANFSTLAIGAGGAVTAGTVADKTGYGLAAPAPTAAQVAAAVWTDANAADFAVAGSPGKVLLANLDANVSSRMAGTSYAAPPTVAAIAGAILATPANLLQTDPTGRVVAGNLPADYQQRGVAVTLPAAPAGYGGPAAPTASQVAAAVWTDTAAADFAVAGSPGKALLANLDANVSSRMAGTSYAAPPTVAAIAGAILATPANLLQTDPTGRVVAGNLPADYQQRGVAVTLPAAPAGYGGPAAPTASQVAAAVWTDTAAADFAVAGSPGKILFTNLDANVASRSTYAGGPVASVTGSVGSLAGVSFPANFAGLAIGAGGAVTAGTVADKTGYGLAAPAPTAAQVAAAVWTDANAADFAVAGSPGKVLLANLDANVSSRMAGTSYAAPPTVAAIAGAILATPANLLQTDPTGRVVAGNLPADYQQRGVAVTLPAAPAGYGGPAAPTASQVAAAVWTDTAAADFAVAGSPGKALLANLDASVSSRSTYAGGPVASVTGNVGGSVGSVAGVSFPANFATLAIGAGGVVTAGTVADKSGYKLAGDGADAVVVEAGVNARQAMSAILASSVGVLSGAATPSITIQGGNVAATRIRATVDPSGNRTTVALSLPA